MEPSSLPCASVCIHPGQCYHHAREGPPNRWQRALTEPEQITRSGTEIRPTATARIIGVRSVPLGFGRGAGVEIRRLI